MEYKPEVDYSEELEAYFEREFGGELDEYSKGWLRKTKNVFEEGDPNADQSVKTPGEQKWEKVIEDSYSN